MKLFRAGILGLFVLLLVPLHVRACDCVNAVPPCKAFANSHAVFAGRVVSISAPDGGYRMVTFDVTSAYRGIDGKTAEVRTGLGGGDCGYEFRVGEQYLVYADPQPNTATLYTGICERTRPLSQAKDDLEYLTKKDDPARGSGIEGDIVQLARDPNNETRTVGFMGGITVTIAGVSGRKTATTDKNGHFKVWGLEPGNYRVAPTLPENFVKTALTVKLAAQSCEEVHFLATPPAKKK